MTKITRKCKRLRKQKLKKTPHLTKLEKRGGEISWNQIISGGEIENQNRGKGTRTLNIAGINPEAIKEAETHRDIIKNITKRKIHISAIQETHITLGKEYAMGGYRIITSASDRQTGRYRSNPRRRRITGTWMHGATRNANNKEEDQRTQGNHRPKDCTQTDAHNLDVCAANRTQKGGGWESMSRGRGTAWQDMRTPRNNMARCRKWEDKRLNRTQEWRFQGQKNRQHYRAARQD